MSIRTKSQAAIASTDLTKARRGVSHTPRGQLAPRSDGRRTALAALALSLALSGCSLANRSAVAEPVAYAPDPMLTPAEFGDDELARDIATRHLADRSAGLGSFEYVRVEPTKRSRAHHADIAIMVLDGPARLHQSSGARELRAGSVVLVPAGVRYRLGPSDKGSAATALVVGSMGTLDTLDASERSQVARLVR